MRQLAQIASALAVALSIAVTAPALAQQAGIVITNGTAQAVDYYLIDAAGNAQFVYTLAPGQQVLQPTQPGLEFAFGVNGQEIAAYRSTADAQQAFTVGAAGPAAPVAPAPVPPSSPVSTEPIVDPTNAEGYAWAYAVGEEDLGFLTYGVPETDDTVLALQCSRRSPGLVHTEFFAGAEVTPGQPTSIGLSSTGAGARTVTAMGNDQGRPVMDAAPDNPLWLNLNDEGPVSFSIANQPAGSVDGFATSSAAGAFFTYCGWQ